MDKLDVKELSKAVNDLAKGQKDLNKMLDNLARAVNDNTSAQKEIRTRLLTLSTSIDNLSNKQNVTV